MRKFLFLLLIPNWFTTGEFENAPENRFTYLTPEEISAMGYDENYQSDLYLAHLENVAYSFGESTFDKFGRPLLKKLPWIGQFFSQESQILSQTKKNSNSLAKIFKESRRVYQHVKHGKDFYLSKMKSARRLTNLLRSRGLTDILIGEIIPYIDQNWLELEEGDSFLDDLTKVKKTSKEARKFKQMIRSSRNIKRQTRQLLEVNTVFAKCRLNAKALARILSRIKSINKEIEYYNKKFEALKKVYNAPSSSLESQKTLAEMEKITRLINDLNDKIGELELKLVERKNEFDKAKDAMLFQKDLKNTVEELLQSGKINLSSGTKKKI